MDGGIQQMNRCKKESKNSRDWCCFLQISIEKYPDILQWAHWFDYYQLFTAWISGEKRLWSSLTCYISCVPSVYICFLLFCFSSVVSAAARIIMMQLCFTLYSVVIPHKFQSSPPPQRNLIDLSDMKPILNLWWADALLNPLPAVMKVLGSWAAAVATNGRLCAVFLWEVIILPQINLIEIMSAR